ncbi:MAG: GNAT family N-acetyltransferase [Pelosinus sp.]|nr:GNAT family N-acetyltransferase [Pelosinus sp.]
MPLKKLCGEQVSLSPVCLEEAEKFAYWLNDLAIALPFGEEAYRVVTVETQRRDLAKSGEANADYHVFSIIENQTDNLVGRCLIFDIDYINRSAKIGLFIGDKECWNKGYGGETVRLLLDYGFNLLNMNSILLYAYAFNVKAIHCYKREGFKEIGRIREARIIGHRRYDIVLLDILAEEFKLRHTSVVDKHLHQ